MMKGDEVIEREEIMIEGTEKTTAAEAEGEDEGEVDEAEEVTDITLKEGIDPYGAEVTYAKGADLITGPATFLYNVPINENDKSGFRRARGGG